MSRGSKSEPFGAASLRHPQAWWRLLAVVLLLLGAAFAARAQVMTLGTEIAVTDKSGGATLTPGDHSLGEFAQVMSEAPDVPLNLPDVQARLVRGDFRPAGASVPHFGLYRTGAWLYLPLDNPTDRTLDYRLYAGESWVDQVDVFLVVDGHPVGQWRAGDEHRPGGALRAGLGFAFDVALPSGRSELFVRVSSIDPAALPVRLVPLARIGEVEGSARQWLGTLQGGLLALMGTFGLLYAVLRERLHLRYVVYVAAFLWMGLCYSGLAPQWLWPNAPQVQRYALWVSMLLFAWAAVSFARHFLGTAKLAPRADRLLARGCLAAFTVIGLCVAADAHRSVVVLALAFTGFGVVALSALGVLAWRRAPEQPWTFLVGIAAGSTGALVSALAVTGLLPLNGWTLHAVEVGVTMEAMCWALALGLRLRRQRTDSARALALAQRDPLTGLNNRRGFLDQALPIWSTAARQSRPLSVILLDIDHLKHINERHGEESGDRVLIEVADRLNSACRAGDIVARWGGEEYALLLPETRCEQAGLLAERLRTLLSATPVAVADGRRVAFTASFGVAPCDRSMNLEGLLRAADRALFAAKDAGRDRVVVASAPPTGH